MKIEAAGTSETFLYIQRHIAEIFILQLLRRLLFISTVNETKILHVSFPPIVHFDLSGISLFVCRILLIFRMPVQCLSVYVNCFAIDSWNCLVFPFLFPSGLNMFRVTYANLFCSFMKILQLQTSVSLTL